MKGRPRKRGETSRDRVMPTAERSCLSDAWRQRYPGETEEEQENTPTRQRRGAGHCFQEIITVLAIETLSHWEKLPSPSQDIFLGAGVSPLLREGAPPPDTPNYWGLGPKEISDER